MLFPTLMILCFYKRAERTRNTRAWLLPVNPVCGPLGHASPPREVAEIIERKGVHKRARNFIFTFSGSFVASFWVPLGVLDSDPPSKGLDEQRGFLPCRGDSFPPNRAGGHGGSCQVNPHPFLEAKSVLHTSGEPEELVWDSPCMAWWEDGYPERLWGRGVGSCSQGLSLPTWQHNTVMALAEHSRSCEYCRLPCYHLYIFLRSPSVQGK